MANRKTVIVIAVCLWLLRASSVATLPNQVDYRIEVTLDTEQHLLRGKQVIDFVNRTGTTLEEFYLHLYPNAYRKGSLFFQELQQGGNDLDILYPAGREEGYIHIHSLVIEGKVVTDYYIDDTIMRIELKPPLKANEGIQLKLAFTEKVPEIFWRLGHHRGNYHIAQWYPKVVVYDKDGWHPDKYHFLGEFYGDFSTYSVSITLPRNMVMGATGRLVDEISHPKGSKTWVWHAENVHDFAWVADESYQEALTQWEDIAIRSLYFKGHKRGGERAARHAREALAYFSKKYGRYPYSTLTVCESYVGGIAMEYPTLIMLPPVLSYQLPSFFTIVEAATAHEIAHQWWYAAVGNNELAEAWLDEGFATYSEMCYIEDKYGKDNSFIDLPQSLSFLKIFHLDDWRSSFYKSWITLSLEGREQELLSPAYEFEYPDVYSRTVYHKGAVVLAVLENLVGEEVFSEIMRTYFESYKFKNATTEDFQAVVEEVSQTDLDWFFQQMLHTTRRCDFVLERVRVRKTSAERYLTEAVIKQAGDAEQMPVEVVAKLKGGGKLVKRWEGNEKWGVVTFETPNPVKEILIDPSNWTLDVNRLNNRRFPKVAFHPLFSFPYTDRYMVTYYPKIGYTDTDGWLGGVGSRIEDPFGHRVSLSAAYIFNKNRVVYDAGFFSPIYKWGNRLSYFEFKVADDRHVRNQRVTLAPVLVDYNSYRRHFFAFEAEHEDNYNVNQEDYDPGVITAVAFSYRLTTNRSALRQNGGQYQVRYEHSLPDGDYIYDKYYLEVCRYLRLGWMATLRGRVFAGWQTGHSPRQRKFALWREGDMHAFDHRELDIGDCIGGTNTILEFPLGKSIEFFSIPLVPTVSLFLNTGKIWESSEIRSWTRIRESGLKNWRAEMGAGFSLECVAFAGLALRLQLPLLINTERKSRGLRIRIGSAF